MNKIIVCLFLVSCLHGFPQDKVNKISGVVSDMGYPLANVNISIKGTTEGIQTDANGKYEIEARPKDVLVYSHVGMHDVLIIVEDVTRILNIAMEADVEELDEVVVAKRKRKTQDNLAKDYFIDSTIINSNLGYLSPDLVGYELRVVDGKDLNTSSRDILDAIEEQLPGTIVRDNPDGRIGRFLFAMSYGSLRGAPAVAYEVDGVLFRESPVWLDIRTVLRVALIPATQAVYGYGKIGGGGIVVINTTNVKYGYRDNNDRPFDHARLRGNIYMNNALDSDMVLENSPIYLKDLSKSTSLEEAVWTYEKYKDLYGGSYSFVLDAYAFFCHRYANRDFAEGIVEEHKSLFESNPVALKTLAYHYQANGGFQHANDIYQNIYIKRPTYAQSYMDLANSYREIDDFKKAAAIHTRYNFLKQEGFLRNDSTSFTPIIDRELNNLVALKAKNILNTNNLKEYVWEDDFKGTRLVFEWDDSEAEFELQFVNPEGHYFVSTHSLAADAERIRKEKLIGYSCEEFLIDESLPGTWQVNVNYLGNKSLTPSYLKATIYQDYGSSAQRKETKVFKLALKNVNQELFKVNNTVRIATN